MIVRDVNREPLTRVPDVRDAHAACCGEPRVGALRAAIWCGLVVGLAELGSVLARKHWFGPAQSTVVLSRHFPWMVLASDLMLFGASGLLLVVLARLRPRFAGVVAPYLLLFQAGLSFLLTIPAFNTVACALLAAGIAYRGVPWATHPRRAGAIRVAIRRSLPALVLIGFALFAAIAGGQWWNEHRALSRLTAAPADAPNVLLVVMDTVRADHLSTYGYARGTTPNLSRLAQGGVRFELAVATAPWTLPSHASLFTGRWAHQLATIRARPLDTNVLTLAEALGAEGYATAGIVGNQFFCSHEYGLDRGFAHYEDHEVSAATVLSASSLGWLIVQKTAKLQAKLVHRLIAGAPPSAPLDFRRKDAARINRDALHWLSVNRHRPFFLFLNYFDVHDPYILPSGPARHFGLTPASQADAEMLRDWHSLNKATLSRRQICLARDAYDDCIAYLDDQLGRLFDALDRRRLLDKTLVIVTADHGEHLGEHDLFGHGVSLYQAEVHVPLLIAYPPSVPRGAVVREPVSLRDVPATVMHLVAPKPHAVFPGASLARCWTDNDRPVPAVLSEVENVGLVPPTPSVTPLADGALESLTTPNDVYIHHQGGREELYDAVRDPQELHDLADQPAVRATVRQRRESLRTLLHGTGTTEGPARF